MKILSVKQHIVLLLAVVGAVVLAFVVIAGVVAWEFQQGLQSASGRSAWLAQRLEGAIWLTCGTFGLCGIAVISASRWTKRRLVDPLEALARGAQRAMVDSEPFVLAEDGPTEVRSVTRAIASFVGTLERRVAKRTSELNAQKVALEDEIRRRKVVEEVARCRQNELAHIARMRTIGEMASVLAHELNQPLCAMVTASQACIRIIDSAVLDVDDLRGGFAQIAIQGQRASDIIAHVRSFVSKQDPQRSLVNINEILQEAMRLCNHLAEQDGVAIELRLADTLPLIHVDAIQIEQVVLNLVRNGIEAMSEFKREARRVVLRTVRVGSGLAVAVRDTGRGIDCDEIERIFDSFYTTKDTGIGIGLALSRSIIETHGGRLWATRNLGRGSTLWFTLPTQSQSGGVAHAA